MKSKIIYSILAIGLMALGYSGCKNPEAIAVTQPLIQPPIPGVEPTFSVFKFDAAQGGTFSLPTGTELTIPANALRDSAGNYFKGEVELKYREFHDAVSVYLSGIPMTYDSAGTKNTFQTAGMFEVRAFGLGKQLSLDSGKTVGVKMASFATEGQYNTYFLDENARNWSFKEVNTAQANGQKVEALEKTDKKKKDAFPFGGNFFTFNYYALLDVAIANDKQQVYAKRKDASARKKVESYGVKWANFSCNEWFPYGEYYENANMFVWKIEDGKEFPNWLTNMDKFNKDGTDWWEHVSYLAYNAYDPNMVKLKALGSNRYQLSITSGKNKFTCNITRMMTIEKLFSRKPEQWRTDYDKIMEGIAKEEASWAFIGDVFRSFEVNQFGIYNYDKLMKEEDKVLVTALFNFPLPDTETAGIKQIVLLPGDNRTLIKYDEYIWDKLPLVPDAGARMFALVPGKKLAIFSYENFQRIDFEALRKQDKPSFTFNFTIHPDSLTSMQQVYDILGVKPIAPIL